MLILCSGDTAGVGKTQGLAPARAVALLGAQAQFLSQRREGGDIRAKITFATFRCAGRGDKSHAVPMGS